MSRPISERAYGTVFATTKNSSPGLDQVDRRVLSRVDHSTMTAHMNLWLLVPQPQATQEMAIITPVVMKAGLDPEEPQNYRPISNLISKVIERIVYVC